MGGGQILNVTNKTAGLQKKCYLREIECHSLLKSPLENTSRSHPTSLSPCPRTDSRPPYSSISMESAVRAQAGKPPSRDDLGSDCEHSFSATLDLGGRFTVADSGSAAVLGAGAAANLVCPKWLARHGGISERWSVPRAETHPKCARLTSGDGRLGRVRRAAEIPSGITGNRGKSSASVLEVDIPALLREGASEGLGGQ